VVPIRFVGNGTRQRLWSQAHLREEDIMSDNTDARDRYWQKTRNLTIVILVLWAFFSLFIPLIVSPLNNLTFLGFPLGYYMIAQGSLIAFVLLIVIQNWRQDAIDREFGFDEE
jgi:putative solute:sodium symporter small subunit